MIRAASKNPPCSITLSGATKCPSLDTAFVRKVSREVMRRLDVCSARVEVALVSDHQIAVLNQRFLGHRGPTDVITFDLGDAPRSEIRPRGRLERNSKQVRTVQSGFIELHGQIVISIDTARRQAKRRGHATRAEVLLYIVHGLLHLMGWADHAPVEARRMHALEDEILTAIGIGAVYSRNTQMRGKRAREARSRAARS